MPCFEGHIRARSNLSGPLDEGNALADNFTQLTTLSQLELAQQSHALHHHSKNLRKQFGLTRKIARKTVKQCDICTQSLPVSHQGISSKPAS